MSTRLGCRGRLASALPGIAAALVIAALGFADGGYFATAWGPLTLVFLSFAAIASCSCPGPSLGLRTLAMPALLGLLVIWTLASSAWGSPSEAVPEVERTLMYLSAALALGLALRRGATTAGVLIGLWAGISAVCLYALATRLFPEQLGVFDQIAGYRLSEPVGYWNALGLLASFGLLLAFGLVARAEHLLVQASRRSVRRPARAHLLLHVQPRRLAGAGRRPPRRARARSSPPAAGADRRGDRTLARVLPC